MKKCNKSTYLIINPGFSTELNVILRTYLENTIILQYKRGIFKLNTVLKYKRNKYNFLTSFIFI